MAVAKKIAYNVFFNSGAKAVSTVLALVGIGLITRYLGKEGFGNYAIAIAFFSFFGSLADLGLYLVATREISRKDADEKKIMGNVFSLRIVSSLVVFLISPIIVYFLPYSPELKMGIIISAAAFLFTSSYLVLNGVFQKNLAMYKVATIEVLGKILQVGLIFLAIQKDWGFLSILVAFLVSSIFNSVVVYLLSRHYIRFKISIDLPYWKRFLRESLPMGISVIITFLYFKIDTILLSFMKDSSAVGVYNAAYKIIENLTFFPAMMIGLIFPLMSLHIFSDKKKFINISDKTFKIFLILITPIVIGTIFLASDIIWLIGGSEFAQSAEVLRILIIALAFIFLGHFFINILLAGNLQKKLMVALAICAAFNITANIIVIPIYSYTGAAITSVATEILVVTLTMYLVYKNLKYLPKVQNMSWIFGSGLIMAAFLFLFGGLNFFILVILSTTIYFLSLWITKTISNEELVLIFSRNSASQKDA